MTQNGKPNLKLLLIEDNKDDEDILILELRRHFKVAYQCVDTEAALTLAMDQSVWDVIICDYKLPEFTSEKALWIVRAYGDMPFFVVSGWVDESVAIELLKLGAHDFISKDKLQRLPFAIKRELIQANNRLQSKLDLEKTFNATVTAWGEMLETRDVYTHGHTVRVTDLTLRLARLMDIPSTQFQAIYRGSLLHDIGKMAIPDLILLKQDVLTPEEWTIMKMHPVIAYEKLRKIPDIGAVINIPYCHHEKWDGTGYPRGLDGDKIPFEARLFSVADVYDALTSDRPYRQSWTKERALEYIDGERGK